jgi:dihydrolipoamide dehydrogenase
MPDTYDLIVLGSGPGGYVAAIRASQLGLKVAIVERENLGGICLNWGCIPTKALLRTSEIYHYMTHAKAYGLSAGQPGFDLPSIVDRSRKVAGQLSGGVKGLMKKHKITVHDGDGMLTGATSLKVTKDGKTTELAAKNIIVATGARARDLPFAKTDGNRIWTYRHAMVPKEMPTNLLVIGSGAIGVEFASFYSDMGAKVTIVEMLDRILPVEDADISAHAHKAFTKQGMILHVSAGVEKLEATGQGVRAAIKMKDGKVETQDFSHAIVAIGIVPNSENIGLEALGVKQTRGHIDTDPVGRTNVAGLWAIGDVTGPPWLAHKAMHEAVITAEAIAGGNPHPLDKNNIPGCTYSRPQVASVGFPRPRPRRPATRSRSANSPSSATARRSRSARRTASSRPSSTRPPASCSAPT